MFSMFKRWIEEYKEIKYLAYHDALTGLYNRHYLLRLNVMNYRYVYFIDINNLKTYNKNGHITGDNHIIKCVKDISDNYVERGDCLLRYAGDEFLLLTKYPKVIMESELYSIGEARITSDFNYSLMVADREMIKNKERSKCCE